MNEAVGLRSGAQNSFLWRYLSAIRDGPLTKAVSNGVVAALHAEVSRGTTAAERPSRFEV